MFYTDTLYFHLRHLLDYLVLVLRNSLTACQVIGREHILCKHSVFVGNLTKNAFYLDNDALTANLLLIQ